MKTGWIRSRAALGFSEFHCVPFGVFLQNNEWGSHQVCGQGNGGQKAHPGTTRWKAPCWEALKPVWIMWPNFQLTGCSLITLFSVTRETVQVEVMFSSRARSALEDSFQQSLCLMLSGCLGVSGLAHPQKQNNGEQSRDSKCQLTRGEN